MMKVIVAGAAGRMGRRIGYMVDQHPSLAYTGAFEAPGSEHIGSDAGELAGIGANGVVIGEGLETLEMESLQYGCVSLTRRFFGDGRIRKKRWKKAVRSVLADLQELRMRYRGTGWDAVVGSSGTIKAVEEICRRWHRTSNFEDFSIAQLIMESVGRAARYRMYLPVEMVLMVKAIVTFEVELRNEGGDVLQQGRKALLRFLDQARDGERFRRRDIARAYRRLGRIYQAQAAYDARASPTMSVRRMCAGGHSGDRLQGRGRPSATRDW